MNFRLRDKSKAKIRNYQINFAASLQIPSPNRKITDRNRPSNSPPPRSPPQQPPYRSLSPCPVLSCPVLFLSRSLLPAASPRPGPNSFRVRSNHDTYPDSTRTCPTISAPQPFPEIESRAGIGPCRNRILAARFAPARNPIRHDMLHDRSTDRIQQNTPAGNSGRGILSIPKSSRGREST